MRRIIILSFATLLAINAAAALPQSQSIQEDKILHKTFDEIKKTYGNPVNEETTWGGGIAVFKVSDSLYYSCYFKYPEAKCYQYVVSDKYSRFHDFMDANAAEIQSIISNAFPGSSSENSGEGGYGTWDMGGRLMLGEMPRPDYSGTQEEGRVVVTITVDPKGNVIETKIDSRTNTTNKKLRDAAEQAARKTKFNPIEGKDNQIGTITYYFKLK